MATIEHDTSQGGGAAVIHLDPEQRASNGRAARAAIPRSAHAAWEPVPDRPDPVALLTGQETTRVPELVPLRHERMLASPFTFYRGAAVIMAADLAATPNAGLRVQACGDAHLSNFGGFAAPDRAWSSTSTTSTRRAPDRSSGTSSVSAPASRSRHAPASFTSQEARGNRRRRRTGLPRGDGRLREDGPTSSLVRTTRRAARVRPVPFASACPRVEAIPEDHLPRRRPRTT